MSEFQVGNWVLFKEDDEAQLLLVFGFEERDFPLFVEDLTFEPDQSSFDPVIFTNGTSPKGVLILKVGDLRGNKSEWIPAHFFRKHEV